MQAQLKELIAKKDQIQKELSKLTKSIQLIDQTKNFSKGLVDFQGFPRNDLDFGQLCNYRNLKRRRAELNNDHLGLMKEIQGKLFDLHALYKSTGKQQWEKETSKPKQTPLQVQNVKPKIPKQQKMQTKIDYLTPFAKISLVQIGSPAEKSGVKVGDLVSEFGEIMIYSLDWMKQIGGIVKEGSPIKVIVMRKKQIEGEKEYPCFELKDKQLYYRIELSVLPAKWGGRGLLGCKIDPL